MKRLRIAVPLATFAAVLAALIPPGVSAAADNSPLWVKHVRNYPGGVSNGPRAMLAADSAASKAAATPDSTASDSSGGNDVQMNIDSNPPVPQDETAVAYNLFNPLIAVAAANDYVSTGLQVMRTTDGGQTWSSQYLTPMFFPTRAPCSGSDPWLDYSRRDQAFYLVTLCFFRDRAESEVHVFKSTDDGRTWTPPRYASVAATNTNHETLQVRDALFLDNNQIVVDNNPTSPHYGRIYVTYVKFHYKGTGFGDYCPVQLSYTDDIPTVVPSDAHWQHTAVVPDDPAGPGKGASANQWARPQVEADGDLDVTYALEDCNTGLDRHLEFQKSTDGGQTFLPRPVRIDKPGQFEDNPDLEDLLPPTQFRAPLSPSLDVNKSTGTLTYLYQNNVNREQSGADISYQQSRDGGFTWTNMKYLSVSREGRPARHDQFFPAVDSDRSGNLFAIWYDRRSDPDNRNIETWQSESFDDGKTWTPNHPISDKDWNPDQGFFAFGVFIGDYNAIAASDQVVYPVWTDGRRSAFSQTGIGETDIFTDPQLR